MRRGVVMILMDLSAAKLLKAEVLVVRVGGQVAGRAEFIHSEQASPSIPITLRVEQKRLAPKLRFLQNNCWPIKSRIDLRVTDAAFLTVLWGLATARFLCVDSLLLQPAPLSSNTRASHF